MLGCVGASVAATRRVFVDVQSGGVCRSSAVHELKVGVFLEIFCCIQSCIQPRVKRGFVRASFVCAPFFRANPQTSMEQPVAPLSFGLAFLPSHTRSSLQPMLHLFREVPCRLLRLTYSGVGECVTCQESGCLSFMKKMGVVV